MAHQTMLHVRPFADSTPLLADPAARRNGARILSQMYATHSDIPLILALHVFILVPALQVTVNCLGAE